MGDHVRAEILAASRTRQGWQNTQSPTHRLPEKKPLVDKIRSSFEDKDGKGRDVNGHTPPAPNSRIDNRRMGAKVSAIANIFQSLSPTPGSPNAASTPVIASPVLADKRGAKTDYVNNRTASRDTVDNKLNKVVTADRNNAPASPSKPRLSPKEGRRLAAEKKENLNGTANDKTNAINARLAVSSAVNGSANASVTASKITRTESRVTRFNNARAMFEKLQKSDSDLSVNGSSPDSKNGQITANSAKPVVLSRPRSASQEPDVAARPVNRVISSSVERPRSAPTKNGTAAAPAAKEETDSPGSRLVRNRFMNSDRERNLENDLAQIRSRIIANREAAAKADTVTSSDTKSTPKSSIEQTTNFSSVRSTLERLERTTTEKAPLETKRSVDAASSSVAPASTRITKSHSLDAEKIVESTNSSTNANVAEKTRSPVKRTSSLKEDLLDKIVSDLAEDTTVNSSAINAALADLNICDTSGIPDSLDFDSCFQGVELMTEEEAEKLLSRNSWPGNCTRSDSRHVHLSLLLDLLSGQVDNATKAAKSTSAAVKEPERPAAAKPAATAAKATPQLPQTTQRSQVLSEQLEKVQKPDLTNEVRDKVINQVQDTSDLKDDSIEPEEEEDNFQSANSSVIIDNVEYTVFPDGHYCSEQPGLGAGSEDEDDNVTMFLCPVPARKKTKVRFSSGPIKCYSTHAVEDYDRRNEDVDPG